MINLYYEILIYVIMVLLNLVSLFSIKLIYLSIQLRDFIKLIESVAILVISTMTLILLLLQ